MEEKETGIRFRLNKLFAIFIFGPFLIYRGNEYNDQLLTVLGIIFVVYELLWTLNYCNI